MVQQKRATLRDDEISSPNHILHYTMPVFYYGFYRSMFYGEVLYPPSSWTRCRVAIQRHLELLMIVNRYTRVITNLAKKNKREVA